MAKEEELRKLAQSGASIAKDASTEFTALEKALQHRIDAKKDPAILKSDAWLLEAAESARSRSGEALAQADALVKALGGKAKGRIFKVEQGGSGDPPPDPDPGPC